MSVPQLEFPALYMSANKGSASAQNRFWWTIRAEYFLLFCVSVASATREFSEINPLIITLILVVLAGLFVFKLVKKLDQDWYRCRALAESVKTSTWRFAMRSHPFDDATSIEQPKAEFRNLLKIILKTNQNLAENLHGADSDQSTNSMVVIRGLPLEERISYYVKNRIDDQKAWYSKKSADNRNAVRFWFAAIIVVYIAAAVSLNAKQLGIDLATYAFDPLIVIVTSAIGWLQIKRHGELTASYNLTAHEIGIIRGNSSSVKTEEEFSDFVNEAELAFSREHTQWVARRDAN